MRPSKSKLLFISILVAVLGWRWYAMPSPLPQSWTPETNVRFTARILEEPEHTDSKTIIRRGIWTIKLSGYQDLKPGETYRFIGKVAPQVLLSRVIEIEMVDPTFEVVVTLEQGGLRIGERVIVAISQWRAKMVGKLSRVLPEPHASLSAGILLGVKASMPRDFYEALVATGTLHIIAASGYNVNIVAAVVMSVLAAAGPLLVTAGGISAIVIYVILAGAGPAVVRAGLMGGLVLLAHYLGRPAEARRLLWVTAGVMLLAQPLMLVEVGFWLSVAATGGLLYWEPRLREIGEAHIGQARFLQEYFYPTMAATLATLPVTLFVFGRASGLGLVVNLLVLPVTPLIMLLSALTLILVPASYLLYVPLWWMIEVISFFG